MSRSIFRLAILSDAHLSPLPALSLADLASKRLTGFLNWHLKRKHDHDMGALEAVIADIHAQEPDHILFCGDAVNIGLPAEFVQARAFLDRLGDGERVTAIPGNHDLYVEAARQPMLAAFGPWMCGDGETAVQFPFVRQRGDVRLFGLNSSLPTPPFDATGQLGAAQISALREGLQAVPEDCARIVALHHPAIATSCAHGRDLRDADALGAMMQTVHADLIIHGHNHQKSLHWLEGVRGKIPVLGAMSASGSHKKSGAVPGWIMADIATGDSHAPEVKAMAHEWQSGSLFRRSRIF